MAEITSPVSSRIHLRALKPGDAEQLSQWLCDQDVIKTSPHFGDTSEEFLKKWIRGSKLAGRLPLGIMESIENSLIGMATLHVVNTLHGSAQTGILIGRKDLWRMGYGNAVQQRILELAFEKLNLHLVEAHISSDDKAAKGLAEKCGYEFIGQVSSAYPRIDGKRADKHIYVISKSRWLASKK